MLLLALLLQAADPPPGADVVVRAPLPASPQTPATIVVEPAAMLIATCDADGDGLVDRIELNEGLEKTFKASDTAKTGAMRYLAYSDWALRWLGDRAALPSPYEVDRNNDDQITLAELQDHFSRLFARYDTNNDKTISRAELLTYRAAPIGSSGPPGSLSRTPKGKPSQPKDQDRRR